MGGHNIYIPENDVNYVDISYLNQYSFGTSISVTPKTFSFNIPTETKLLVLAIGGVKKDLTVNDVTINSISLTKLTPLSSVDSVYMYYMINPPTGTKDIVVSFDETGGAISCDITATYYNTNGTFIFESVDSHTNTGAQFGKIIATPNNRSILIHTISLLYYDPMGLTAEIDSHPFTRFSITKTSSNGDVVSARVIANKIFNSNSLTFDARCYLEETTWETGTMIAIFKAE